MPSDRFEACQLVCRQCRREGVDDVKSGLCESCIARHEDRVVRSMIRTVENMRRWQGG